MGKERQAFQRSSARLRCRRVRSLSVNGEKVNTATLSLKFIVILSVVRRQPNGVERPHITGDRSYCWDFFQRTYRRLKDALIQAGRKAYFYELLGGRQGGRGARRSMIAPLFLTSALFAYKFLVENVPAANAIADGVGSFDSVRRSPHSAQDDS